jgi:tetratricopeptide (TPR) repeat protein
LCTRPYRRAGKSPANLRLGHLRLGLIGVALVFAALALPSGAAAQAQRAGPAAAQAPQDSSLFEVAAMRARLLAAQQERPVAPGRARRSDPTLAAYLEGIARLGRRQFDSALAPLRGAVTASPNNARYHGDLGYALAGLGRWEESADAYGAAARLQSTNPWYYVGLAAVRAKQEQWQQAKANYERAVGLDSSIIDRRLVLAVSDCMERGGFDPELIAWSRIETMRYPDDPAPWLRLATLLRQSDSAEGLAAIRHFRTLAPDHLLGAALYALYLIGLGRYDSSLALARQATADSVLWRLAWPVYLRAGAQLLQARDLDQASRVLEEGRGFAPAARHAQFSLFLGYANVQRLGPLYADAARTRDCAKGHVVDSLETSARHDLEEGKAVADTTQINQILGTVLTQARARIDELLSRCPKP